MHVTPKSYLSFIGGYKTIYAQKRTDIGERLVRMGTGLEKLVEASESIAELSKELALKEQALDVASANAEEVLKQVLSPVMLDWRHWSEIWAWAPAGFLQG